MTNVLPDHAPHQTSKLLATAAHDSRPSLRPRVVTASIENSGSNESPLGWFSLRNNYLYHYPNDKNLEKAFKRTREDEPWEWYLVSTNTSSAYFSSELVLGNALMRETGEPTDIVAFSVVMTKAKELANTVPDFLMRLIETIFKRHLRADVLKPCARTTISDAPRFGEFWLPFFIEE